MQQISQLMMESIFEVFEKMIFVFLEPTEEPGSDFDLESEIRYQGGSKQGRVRILLPKELAGTMTQNMLGLDSEDITERHEHDCVKEAVNMICGNFLSKFDNKEVYNLSIPTLKIRPSEEFAPGDGIYRLDFESDNGKICIILSMQ
jgi:chemotaxis protein CheY-P-specific phosphatase CheC